MENKLREQRLNEGLTQIQLAKKSGVSRAIISGLENNTLEVTTTKTLEKLAQALQLRVSELFFTEQVQHGRRTDQKAI